MFNVVIETLFLNKRILDNVKLKKLNNESLLKYLVEAYLRRMRLP